MNTANQDRSRGCLSLYLGVAAVLVFWGGSGAIIAFAKRNGSHYWESILLVLTCVGYVCGLAGLTLGIVGVDQDAKPRIAGLAILLNLANTVASSLMALVFTLPLLIGIVDSLARR